MTPSTTNVTTISIIQEYDKIDLLEKIIKHISNDFTLSVSKVETIVSKLIDFIIINDIDNIEHTSNILRHIIYDTKIVDIIIKISNSIGKNTHLSLTIKINKHSMKFIEIINNHNNLEFLHLF